MLDLWPWCAGFVALICGFADLWICGVFFWCGFVVMVSSVVSGVVCGFVVSGVIWGKSCDCVVVEYRFVCAMVCNIYRY